MPKKFADLSFPHKANCSSKRVFNQDLCNTLLLCGWRKISLDIAPFYFVVFKNSIRICEVSLICPYDNIVLSKSDEMTSDQRDLGRDWCSQQTLICERFQSLNLANTIRQVDQIRSNSFRFILNCLSNLVSSNIIWYDILSFFHIKKQRKTRPLHWGAKV